MGIVISGKTIMKVGALCGALAAIGGVMVGTMAAITPILASDKPPFSNLDRVQEANKKIGELAQNFQLMQQNQMRSNQTQLFLARGFWSQQLVFAQQAMRIRPNDVMARQQAMYAQQQLEEIQRMLAASHQ